MKGLKRLLFFIFLMFPCIVFADGIDNFFINATLMKNGDLVVEEYFELDGSYNGFERILYYNNPNNFHFDINNEIYGPSDLYDGSDIKLIEIRALDKDSNFDFTSINGKKFTLDNYASKGDYGVYSESSNTYGMTYKIFNPSNKNKAFYIKYRITNIAVKYLDVSELYWNVPINELNEDIDNLRVLVSLEDVSDEFRVWAHGPLHGEVTNLNNTQLLATVSGVNSYSGIDVRMVFDSNYLSETSKVISVNALDKILNYEVSKANQANYEREQMKKQKINSLYDDMKNCQKSLRQSCYDDLEAGISSLDESDDKKNLVTMLLEIKDKVIENENKIAYEEVLLAEKYVSYTYYDSAIRQLKNVKDAKVLEELEERLFVVREKIEDYETTLNTFISGCSIILIVFIISYYLILRNNRKNGYKKIFDQSYYRDIPDISPSQLSYLMNGKDIKNDAISAEILMLACNKKIKIEKIEGKKDDCKFIRLVEIDDTLTKLEKDLMLFVFGNNTTNEITLSELKKNVRKKSSYYGKKWNSINRDIKSDSKKMKLFLNNTDSVTKANGIFMFIFMIISGMGLVALVISPIVFVGYFIYYFVLNKKDIYKKEKAKQWLFIYFILFVMLFLILLLVSGCNLIFSSSLFIVLVFIALIFFYYEVSIYNPLSENGMELYGKAKGLENFMKDFSIMNKRELPEISLWEKYLVFAMILGCGEKVAKAMELHLDGDELSNIYIGLDTFGSFNKVLTNDIVAYTKSSYSTGTGSYSSGSGGGGGFSSGGGFGGGGGGGGRF